MATVDVDDSCQFSADSQPKSFGLVWGLAATRRSVYIHQMNRVNSGNDCGHDDSTINIVMAIIIIITYLQQPTDISCQPGSSSKPAPVDLLLWAHAGTDGRTLYHFTDPAPQTMQAVPINSTSQL